MEILGKERLEKNNMIAMIYRIKKNHAIYINYFLEYLSWASCYLVIFWGASFLKNPFIKTFGKAT